MNMRQVLSPGLILLACLLQGCAPVATKELDEDAWAAKERASTEAYREDQRIETVAVDHIYEQFKILIHVNVTSFNRRVLLSGEVPDGSTRAAIEKIVSGIAGVRHVNNELAVSGNSSLGSRSNDSMITSKIKLQLARDSRIESNRIKPVTESGTVFLMGSVKRAEAEAAAEIASTTSGVKLVVKLFDYAD